MARGAWGLREPGSLRRPRREPRLARLPRPLAPADAAKAKRTTITKVVNQPVPDRGGGAVRSSITVGKKFRGAKVTDVNVNLNFSSNCSGDPNVEPTNCVSDLIVLLDPPGPGISGTSLSHAAGGTSIVDLTIDEQSPNVISNIPPSIEGPEPNRLYPPYVGSAKPDDGEQWRFYVEGGPMNGKWTLSVTDTLLGFPIPSISTLGSWRLELRGRRGKRK